LLTQIGQARGRVDLKWRKLLLGVHLPDEKVLGVVEGVEDKLLELDPVRGRGADELSIAKHIYVLNLLFCHVERKIPM